MQISLEFKESVVTLLEHMDVMRGSLLSSHGTSACSTSLKQRNTDQPLQLTAVSVNVSPTATIP